MFVRRMGIRRLSLLPRVHMDIPTYTFLLSYKFSWTYDYAF